MNARTKLNQGFVQEALVIAAIIGAVSGSWIVFTVILTILIALNLHSGDIRIRPGR